jgi:hypothetical protein
VATSLGLAWIAASIAGCAESSPTATSRVEEQITTRQALSYASAVNLRAADDPGTTSNRYTERVRYPPTRARTRDSFSRCAGLPAGRPTMEIQSPILQSAYWWMRSTAWFMSSRTFASDYATTLGSPRGWHCLLPHSPGFDASFRALAAPPPSVGLRVTQNLGKLGQSNDDVFAFAAGRLVVTLTIEGSRMPSPTTEQRILSLLHRRAEAHKL